MDERSPDRSEEESGISSRSERAEAFFARLGERIDSLKEHASSEPLFTAGTEVGPYRIVAAIGSGGMGVVYRAVDPRLGRDVALKFLPSHFLSDPRAVRRFREEARAVASLDHPNVCTVHEIGKTDDGRPYMAMALYRGETLKARVERGPLPVEEAVRVATDVARALEAAHEHGIIHRDVKPGNILIAEGGTVKLLDFGLAKLGDATLTEVGRRLGTVAYMSPEQTRAGKVEPETDLWSLGVVLYEMLAGRRPFGGGSAAVILEAIRDGHPAPPSILRADLPEGLEELVLGLLSPDPEARRRPFGALLGEPERVEVEVVARPAGGWRRPVLVGGAAMALIVGGAFLLRTPARPDLPEIRRLAVLPLADSTHAPEQHYLVEGLHQATVEDLTRSGAVTVSSPDAVERYRNGTRSPGQIARELGVDAVVQGVVWTSGDSLRVELSLLQGESGAPVWTGSYVGSARGEMLALPSRISAGIVAALGAESARPEAPAASRAGGRDPRAEHAYLRGLYELRLHKNQGPSAPIRRQRHVRAAIADFKEAVRIEPSWAAAHAQLASAYGWLVSGMSGSDSSYYWGLSKAAALRALSLDESQAAAFNSLGFVLFAQEHNWVQAERALRRAIELEPSSVNHWAYAMLLLAVGRYAESIDHFEEAERRDPVSTVLHRQLTDAYVCAGRYGEAVARYRQILKESNGSAIDSVRVQMAYAYSRAGRHREAAEILDEAIAVSDSSALDVANLAYVLARAGEAAHARALVRWLDERHAGWDLEVFDAGAVLAAVGQRERAVAAYQRGIERGWFAPIFIRCAWSYPVLRDEPRIRKIERSMHFPDDSASGRQR